MIVNLRGTHGSGKSTVVRNILNMYPYEVTDVNAKGRPNNYRVRLRPRKWLYIVGPYETACGGADAVQPYDLIWPRVEAFAEDGDVLFEGALVSSCLGSIARAMAARKDCVVAFLDTPLNVCLERISKRRAARGDDRPLNPRNTQAKYDGIRRQQPQLEMLGLRCVTIPYRRALRTVLALLGEQL